ncbi:unnamed protein product [Didymodactylos carnosus]|uniref:Uncharacterized protein n=1 Tax=Didymodactylos carnosus TaxID=1234261 RepID=A0A8S2U808_9BILA|nr:unnamed protein product [Didymodactylos carnosus]CAF4328884.1 unnamed protein product [Didymodactylos carnosus]
MAPVFLYDYERITIAPYCISTPSSTINSNYTQQYTFEELKQWNVTPINLYNWYSPLNIIENYHQYLLQTIPNNLTTTENMYYNCTHPWFGRYCEYKLDDEMQFFPTLVSNRYEMKEITTDVLSVTNGTCYIRCQGRHTCLDWRKICDGMYMQRILCNKTSHEVIKRFLLGI